MSTIFSTLSAALLLLRVYAGELTIITEASTIPTESDDSVAPAPASFRRLPASLRRRRDVVSDCARRLNHYSRSSSACVVTRNNKALLVWVPYGRSPGWDFPGGTLHSGEKACETAERESCEETGFQVRAVRKLSGNVFKCEIVAENVCRKPVDEGFLRKKWVSRDEINGLQYRGGTWGDKKRFLRDNLSGSSSTPSSTPSTGGSSGLTDSCGCDVCNGEGFSSGRNRCNAGSLTESREACACARRNGSEKDACGCNACTGEGWSSTRGRCASGSDTSAQEACACKKGSSSSRSCSTSGWSDVKRSCGDCRVLADRMSSKHRTCNEYCKQQGRPCAGAYEEVNNNCVVQSQKDCNFDFDFTSDAICECA